MIHLINVFIAIVVCVACTAQSHLILDSCSPKTVNGLRGLYAGRNFNVGDEIAFIKQDPKTIVSLFQQLNYVNSAAIPDWERIFTKGTVDADIQTLWNEYQLRSEKNSNININIEYLHMDFTETSNAKYLRKYPTLPYPHIVTVTVTKRINKGEPLLRQYGLSWISLVHDQCAIYKTALCFCNKNFKNVEKSIMCKPKHQTAKYFASLWNQQERDDENLVLMDKKTSKRYKRVLKRMYEFILPTMTTYEDRSKLMGFLVEMTSSVNGPSTKGVFNLLKKWKKRGLISTQKLSFAKKPLYKFANGNL